MPGNLTPENPVSGNAISGNPVPGNTGPGIPPAASQTGGQDAGQYSGVHSGQGHDQPHHQTRETARQDDDVLLSLRDVTIGYGTKVIQSHVTMDVRRGSIFAIMGGSGCGKSTILRSMVGLLRPMSGKYTVDGDDYWSGPDSHRTALNRRFGVLFQSGALWSSMTIGENVSLPLEMFTRLNRDMIRHLVEMKLGLVGLSHAIDLYPSEISGGMCKRAGLARAMALDPDVLFFDEPSAGLDPITSARLDDLILTLRDGLGATIVIVSHELPSLFAIADDGIFLDAQTKQPIAHGSPRDLRDHCKDPQVHAFMNREARTETSTTEPATTDPAATKPGNTESAGAGTVRKGQNANGK